jgi:hypothetical protein
MASAPEFKQFRLALIQLGSPTGITENPTETEIKEANLKHARDMIDQAANTPNREPNLIVLPVSSRVLWLAWIPHLLSGVFQFPLWSCPFPGVR